MMSLMLADPTRSSARRIGRPTMEGKTVMLELLDSAMGNE